MGPFNHQVFLATEIVYFRAISIFFDHSFTSDQLNENFLSKRHQIEFDSKLLCSCCCYSKNSVKVRMKTWWFFAFPKMSFLLELHPKYCYCILCIINLVLYAIMYNYIVLAYYIFILLTWFMLRIDNIESSTCNCCFIGSTDYAPLALSWGYGIIM